MAAAPPSAEHAARAGIWSAVDIVGRQAIQFAVIVIVARLLPPDDFGVIALLAVFTGMSLIIVEGGPSTALIRKHDSTREQESSVFWFNLAAGLLCGALILAVAPLVAGFYELPVLVPLMGAAAAQVAIAALGSVPTAILTRSLQFRSLLYAGTTSALISGGVGVGLALAGFGVWALALQTLTAAVVTTVMVIVLSGWRPLLRFDFAGAGGLFRFGSHVILSGFLDLFYNQGFALIIGKLHGVRELGLYNRAQGTQAMPSGVIALIIGRLALPLLATRSGDPEGLRRAVRRAIGAAMALNVPVMIGIAVLSDLVIVALFGSAWTASAPILTVLAFAGILWPLHVINLQALLAQDRSRLYLWITIAKQSFGIAVVAIGSFFGVMGLAYSQVAFAVAAMLINAWPSRRHFGYGPLAQLRDIAGTLAIGALMGAALSLARPLGGFGPFIDLLLFTASGALLYGVLAVLFRIEGVLDLLRLARQLVGARAAKAAS